MHSQIDAAAANPVMRPLLHIFARALTKLELMAKPKLERKRSAIRKTAYGFFAQITLQTIESLHVHDFDRFE